MFRAIILLGCAALLHAQTAFEAASIKPSRMDQQSHLIRPSAGGLTAQSFPVKNMITWAYQVKDFQVVGGPSWMGSDYFDVDAKAPGKASPAELQAMMQTLLKERFKLALHHETREQPIYALTVAKGGPKIQPMKPDDCVPRGTDLPSGKGAGDFCGVQGLGNGLLLANKATMPNVAKIFELAVGRPVVDHTGIAGEFVIHLKFAPNDAPPDSDLPNLFTAVQEQLGLKLEPARGPVDVVVIDSIEKLSGN